MQYVTSRELYAEGRVAESKADFIHKLKIALKELNESHVWLRKIIRANLVPATRMSDLIDECQQLCRILNSSLANTKANSK